jgi:asparagine synthase (glutamine-hydrolysing)
MCGICGIAFYDKSRHVNKSLIESMTNSLIHRGPDDYGIWVNDNIGLGHRRLSIIDLTFNGHQPMSNETDEIWITYNGEIYNFPEIKNELTANGHRFLSQTDTEVIIHLYEEEGDQCLDRLRGMFAFGLWDEKEQKLFIARDRMGQKPVYYYEDNEKLIFASEIKSIFSSGMVKKEIDYEAIYQYLHLGYVPHPKTGFKDIKKLPPGHCIIIKDKKLELERYYYNEKILNTKLKLSEEELSERLVDKLKEATKIRMIGDVPVGLLLSGGIDSKAIATLASNINGRINTFTVGFEDKFYDERIEAAAMAKTLDSVHHELVIKPDVTAILPKIAEAYDEPFADPSAIPSYYISEFASKHVKVVLNGDGGDETFAGYGEYIQGLLGYGLANIPSFICSIFPKLFNQKSDGKFKSLAQVLSLGGNPIEYIFAHLRLVVPHGKLNSILNPEFHEVVNSLNPVDHLIKYFKGLVNNDTINTMLAVDQGTFLPDDLLFKIDVATMAHGLEARSPFLDHQLIEFVNRIPGNLKIRGMKKKYILKRAMNGILPAEVLERPKHGFDVPVSGWLRGILKDLCEDIIKNNYLIRQLFQKNQLWDMLTEHNNNVHDHGKFFWTIIMLHFWSEQFHSSNVDIR